LKGKLCGDQNLCISILLVGSVVGVLDAKVKTPLALDAKAVVDALKAQGLPVTNVIVFSAANDPNKLLGRPRQYSSKANFQDARYIDQKIDDQYQHTVEVFPSAALATERKAYVDRVTRGVAFLQQYQFQNGKILLRLDHVLMPEEAAKYNDALKFIAAGK
jgi:hypothetical protein